MKDDYYYYEYYHRSPRSSIEELTAQSSRLNTEIKNLEAEIAKNEEALAKATAIRPHSSF